MRFVCNYHSGDYLTVETLEESVVGALIKVRTGEEGRRSAV